MKMQETASMVGEGGEQILWLNCMAVKSEDPFPGTGGGMHKKNSEYQSTS